MSDRLKRKRAIFLSAGVLFAFVSYARGQAPRVAQPNPGLQERSATKTDNAAVQRGNELYRPSCAFCHGADARGGAGPDLARSLVVLNDVGGKDLALFLRGGRPAAGMPAFPEMTAEQAGDISAFLHARIEESRARTPMNVNAIVVGNAADGAAFFNGKGRCNSCHNPNGDFKGIGVKYDPFVLQGRIINPRGRPPIKPSTVKVTSPSGEIITGLLVSVSDFSVTLIDAAGNRHTLERDNDVPKVEISDPYQAHLDNFLKMTDKDMHDLTAYLVTLK
jgi:cytochrome c oxidase cbb3-type subunit 3